MPPPSLAFQRHRVRTLVSLAFTLLLAAVPRIGAQVTESPEPIGPGRFLIEMDGIRLSLGRADAAGNTYDGLAVASTIVSVGLTSRLDLQAGIDLFLRERIDARGTRDARSGIGDISFRAKWMFWRDESLGALAVIPHVRLPSSSGGMGADAVEGGVIIPWAGKAGGFTTGAMLHWDVVRNDDDNGYDFTWLLSGFVQRELPADFAVYAEGMLQVASTGFNDRTAEIGVGLLWQFKKMVQLDYELVRGLNSRAADWTHVFRVTWGW